jgi:hypothetical protein
MTKTDETNILLSLCLENYGKLLDLIPKRQSEAQGENTIFYLV